MRSGKARMLVGMELAVFAMLAGAAEPAPDAGRTITSPGVSLVGGSFRLEPVIVSGGGESADARYLLVGSVGQASVGALTGGTVNAATGFWTPRTAGALDGLFRNGFE